MPEVIEGRYGIMCHDQVVDIVDSLREARGLVNEYSEQGEYAYVFELSGAKLIA